MLLVTRWCKKKILNHRQRTRRSKSHEVLVEKTKVLVRCSISRANTSTCRLLISYVLLENWPERNLVMKSHPLNTIWNLYLKLLLVVFLVEINPMKDIADSTY